MDRLTSTSSVTKGNSIDFTFVLDKPTTTSYSSNNIADAMSAPYVVTNADFVQALTDAVRYTDREGSDEHVIPETFASPAPSENTNQASFIITSDGDVHTPLVGDELTVIRYRVDPQGDGTLSYQWFVVGGDDIAGATEASYMITNVGQTIGVRVSYTDGEGFDEVVTVQLSVASILVDPDAYTVVRNGDGTGADRLVGTSANEIIQGGNKADIITTGGGDDIVIGGYGRDKITLSDDGAETIVYRFSSNGADGWTAIDGADRVHNFKRGVDKLEFVDVDTDTPVDLAGFLAGIGSFSVRPNLKGNLLTGVVFQFIEGGLPDGPGTGDGISNSGRWFGIYYAEEDWVTVYNDDGSITDEGAKFLGEDGAYYLSDGDRSRDRVLTDLSLLANYFGEGFDEGFQIIAPEEVGLITDGDDGDADFEVTSSGDINAVAAGDVLSVALGTSDPDGDGAFSYQWKRGGGGIAGATSASYTVTAADLGRALTVTVSYTDGGGKNEHVTSDAVDIPAAPLSADQASFIIVSDGEIRIPLVGDELEVTLDNGDPQGEGTFSYQWFVVGGADIAGATEASYTITQADQVIAVRVSYTDGDGTDETVTTGLGVASFAPIVDPSAYTLVQDASHHEDSNFLTGTSADEIIQGGNKDDTINSGGGDDIIIGGYGRDKITLRDDGAETIVYRFSSDGEWTAIDGSDTVFGFDRGVDKLVLVDVGGTPIDYDSFIASDTKVRIKLILDTSVDQLAGIRFVFNGNGFDAGPEGGANSGNKLTIYWRVSDHVSLDDAKYTGEGRSGITFTGGRNYELTDLSLLPNYFKEVGKTFDDELRIIEPIQLGVGVADANEGVAAYIIIAATKKLVEGSMLYARRLYSDPDGDGEASYQWRRGGGDIAGATRSSYAVTGADLGRDLSVVVSYIDGDGTAERVTSSPIDIPARITNDTLSLTITIDGEIVDTRPIVGQELTVYLNRTDPDRIIDGTFSYQWFVVGGADIAGATGQTYTITEANQIIAVRASYTDGSGNHETVTAQLSLASVIRLIDPSEYKLVQHDDGNEADFIKGKSRDEIIQGGNNNDFIVTSGGDDIVIGGHGKDWIFLSKGDGVETIVYRFSSDGADGWTAIDGSDWIHRFELGVDKLVLVDVDDTPVDRAGFLGGIASFAVRPNIDDNLLRGFTIQFIETAFPDDLNTDDGSDSGKWLKITYKDPIIIYNDFDGALTEKSEKFFGLNFASYDSDSGSLTDFSVLPNYFGEGLDDGLRVIDPSELGVDII